MTRLPPGSTIGILGGGQLGRMLAVAAAQLGYRTHVLAPDAESVAAQTASSFTRADYHSRIVLDEIEKWIVQQLLLEMLLKVQQGHVQKIHRLVQARIDLQVLPHLGGLAEA